MGIETFIINLERRPDRLTHMKEQMKNAGIEHYRVYKAFDNKVLGLKDAGNEAARLGNSFVGIYLSHLAVIKTAISLEYKEVLILEDDAVFPGNFMQQWAGVRSRLPYTWDMVYLNYGASNKEHLSSDKGEVREGIYRANYIGCFGAYMLTRPGLLKLHTILNQLIADHVDISLAKYNTGCDDFEAYYITPALVPIYFELGSDNV